MKRLTDRKTIIKKILQSLPAVVVAVAFVIYGATFLPATIGQMERSVVLVEGVSYYELRADGRPVMMFRSLGDSLLPENLSFKADSTVVTRTFMSGFWVKKLPFIASCGGRIVIANSDSTAAKQAVLANKTLPKIIEKAAERMTALIRRLDRKAEETDYYMRVHNVNDDGYNVMAEYSESIKAQKEKTGKLLSALKRLATKKHIEVRLIAEYALITADSTGNTSRTVCNVMTKRMTSPFLLLRTEDGTMTDGARAVYLHRWLSPSLAPGDSVITAAIAGCGSYKFNPRKARQATFTDVMRDSLRHDVPSLLAPDGAVVFTRSGRLAGVSTGGRITKPAAFGLGLKELLK